MDILVCVKQVPDSAEIKIDPVTHTLVRTGVPSVINPFDKHAVEAAVQLKEKNGGTVTVVSMGPKQAEAVLKECISVGADRAILVSDKLFGGSDTYATSYILASAIKKIGHFDLIICGKQATDGDTGQVGPAIAEHLGYVQLTYAANIEVNGESIIVKREMEDGYEVVESKLPAVCTVVKSINEPRLPTIKSKLASNRAVIETITFADIPDIDRKKIGLKGSPTRVKKTDSPPKRADGVKVTGQTGSEAAHQLIEHLLAEKMI